MNWYQLPGASEFGFIAAFLLLYIIFVFINMRKARLLGATGRALAVKFVLRLSYFLLFIVAILGPIFGESKKEIKTIGKNIYIAVDLSRSMDASDVQPSRLEKVKYELSRLLLGFESDRIGLIIFAADAFVQCPLTYDHNALSIFIESLNTRLISGGGTQFAPAIRLALDKFKDADNVEGKAGTRILLLVSDGEDFDPQTAEALTLAEENQMRIFCLGVGTQDGAPIIENGKPKTDLEGKQILTSLKSDVLMQMAQRTNGDFLSISSTADNMDMLIKSIQAIKGQIYETQQLDIKANKYIYPLLLGLGLLILDMLFTIQVIRL